LGAAVQLVEGWRPMEKTYQPASISLEIFDLEEKEINPGAKRLQHEDQEKPVILDATPVRVNQHPDRKGHLAQVKERPGIPNQQVQHCYVDPGCNGH
jgi:hypothetical protein